MDLRPLLEELLRQDDVSTLISDFSTLSCGCVYSETRFRALASPSCPLCFLPTKILKPVPQLRELHRILELSEDPGYSRKYSRRLSRREETRVGDSLDLMGLFCKFAKNEQAEQRTAVPVPIDTKNKADSLVRHDFASDMSVSPYDRSIQPIEREHTRQTTRSDVLTVASNFEKGLALNELQEFNFSRCFPFYRRAVAYPTHQVKSLFKFNSLVTKSSKFTCSAIYTMYDTQGNIERTRFVLIADHKWELFEYITSQGRPRMIAMGKSSGEFGTSAATLKSGDLGLVVTNEFGEHDSKPVDMSSRLKTSVQLSCCLSDQFLVISSTKGIVRLLNADEARGEIGAPVYTYITDYPIRCVALSPNNELLACGITARERVLGKQQPFVILHPLKFAELLRTLLPVSPITITVPHRDPLKILRFNATLTHLLCSTVYEMRYFIIRLRDDLSADYKRPRLIWSDMRVNRKTSRKDSNDTVDELFGGSDDQMLDNEGITDIKFGLPYTNTILVTSSLLKNRPSLVLKLNGPPIDLRRRTKPSFPENLDIEPSSSENTAEYHADGSVDDVDVVLKVPEIGSSVYGAEILPRGDGIVFVEKLGRLYLVSTPSLNHSLQSSGRKSVVLLGEAADALRFSEAASVKFSSDGGKVFVVDRKGIFQIFDFTHGVPGEDPEVIKCKIISV